MGRFTAAKGGLARQGRRPPFSRAIPPGALPACPAPLLVLLAHEPLGDRTACHPCNHLSTELVWSE